MNNRQTKKIGNILGLIEKDFKVTNFSIHNKKVTIDFESNGVDDDE